MLQGNNCGRSSAVAEGTAVVGVLLFRSPAVAAGLASDPTVTGVLAVRTIVPAVAAFLMLQMSCRCSIPAVAGALLC
jgi:hypothetical protein